MPEQTMPEMMKTQEVRDFIATLLQIRSILRGFGFSQPELDRITVRELMKMLESWHD